MLRVSTPCFVLGDLVQLPGLAHDLALAFLQVGDRGFHRALRVVHGKIGQFDLERELILLFAILGIARRGLDEANLRLLAARAR